MTKRDEIDLRITALGEANKHVYVSVNSGVGGSNSYLSPATVVERAAAYYNFLIGAK